LGELISRERGEDIGVDGRGVRKVDGTKRGFLEVGSA
jgi:hypothetical protein